MEDLIATQQQLVGAIEQLYTNFKKDGSDRKTADYIRRRLETLDQYWQEFQNNHFQLCGHSEGMKSHDYFMTDQFGSTKERYGHIKSVIVNYQARDAKPSTSLLRPATPLGSVTTPRPSTRTSSPAARADGAHEEVTQKTDVTCELVEELQTKTKEFLQPNPTARAKMAAVKGISKLSGQAKSNTYPQPEGVLGDCMLMYGKKLGEDTVFSQCLIEMGEAMKQMADVKYSLDDNIKQSFLEPLHHLQTKDLKEVMHHRKKLQGRRLDFDCKRRRQAKGAHIPDDEIRQAEEKFAESLSLAQIGMFNLLDNDVEQVAQLSFFAEGLLEYHQQCTEILKGLVSQLMEKKEEAINRPKMEFVPKTLADLQIEGIHELNHGKRYGSTQSLPRRAPAPGPAPSSSLADLTALNRAWDTPPKAPPLKQAPPPNYRSFQPMPAPRNANGRDPWTASPLPSPVKSPARTPNVQQKPCCTALYDFDPENQGELGFKENDVITLINKVDDNWFEGSLNGKTGYFPISYVQVTVPLPNM